MTLKMTNNWKKYILWFAQEHVDFRVAVSSSIYFCVICFSNMNISVGIQLNR